MWSLGLCCSSGNIGVFARYAAEAIAAAGGSAQIHSFEPLPPVHALHKRNTEELDGVILHNFGLCAGNASTAPSSVTFEYFPGLPGNGTMKFEERDMFQKKLFASTEGVKKYLSQLASTSRALRCFLALVYPCRAALVQRFYAGRAADHIPYECELRTASSVIDAAAADDIDIPVIDLLKIDVEGAELDVMQGFEDAQWKIVRQVVAEVHDTRGGCRLCKISYKRQDFTSRWCRRRCSKLSDSQRAMITMPMLCHAMCPVLPASRFDLHRWTHIRTHPSTGGPSFLAC